MQNLSESVNGSSEERSSVIVKVCTVVPLFCLFLFCVAVTLHVFASHRQFAETTRYILFATMLVNDTLQILSSIVLFLLVMGRVQIAMFCCLPLIFISTVTFKNTPLILATMALERYVAIVYPLQCPVAWRPNRIWVIVVCVWTLTVSLGITEFSMGGRRPAVDHLSTPVFCKLTVVNSGTRQVLLRAVVSMLFFAAVAAIILFTYVKILLETRKLRQDRASLSKAMRTVLLHGLQLLLCMLAFTLPITESLIVLHANWAPQDVAFFNYFCFILVPRFLSPLIYGFRDSSLRGHVARAFLCCSADINPRISLKPHNASSASPQIQASFNL